MEHNTDRNLRNWMDSRYGVQAIVIQRSCANLGLVRSSSMTVPHKKHAQNLEHGIESTFSLPSHKYIFGRANEVKIVSDVQQQCSSAISPSLNCHKQRIENIMIENISKLGWTWIELVNFELTTIYLRLEDRCPVESIAQVNFCANSYSVKFCVTSRMFDVEDFDWERKFKTCALLHIKDVYLHNYAKHTYFFQQLKELEELAVVFETSFESVPTMVPKSNGQDVFHPKVVVLKVLLSYRHDSTILAHLAVRSDCITNTLDCTCRAIEVTKHSDRRHVEKTWEANASQWSSHLSLAHNIELIFCVDLARAREEWNRGGMVAEDALATPECAICYCAQSPSGTQTSGTKRKRGGGSDSRLLSTALETIASQCELQYLSCQNSKCDKLFHTECARNWLFSLPDIKESFGVMFGACPYCADTLEVSK